MTITVKKSWFKWLINEFSDVPAIYLLIPLTIAISVLSTFYSLGHNIILAYGDAQSHINISKRVVDSITPGMAQLGGVWLPLPHLLMVPFVKFELLYRSGLAGSIVSGAAFVIAAIYVYRLALFITKNGAAAFISFVVFVSNPNILYIQTTPLTEMTLITFFILSTYYFTKYIYAALQNKRSPTKASHDDENFNLVLAAIYGFCASISRYDGWFLVLFEAAVVVFIYLPIDKYWADLKAHKITGIFDILKHKLFITRAIFDKMSGMLILFTTLAFVGIFLWFAWDWLILGNPLYFSNSAYSAGSQQKAFAARGQLPAYHNLPIAFEYYFFDAMSNIGVIAFFVGLVGLIVYLLKEDKKIFALLASGILVVPFIFNVTTLFLGQSIIYIPSVTPANFEWKLFNARYGILMLPGAAIFFGLLYYYAKPAMKLLLVALIFMQVGLYLINYSPVIILSDGIDGLSASKTTDADLWMKKNYDGGLILMDDFARSLNIVADGLPMQNIIYIGNKPYYQESMVAPEKYAKWIAIQENDDVWNQLWQNPDSQARLYKYFNKVYTSPHILIFKRMGT